MPGIEVVTGSHPRWVRISHWIVTTSVLTLGVTGWVILMAHPRLYWGEAGNDLMPALIELPISRNYQHGGWDERAAFFDDGRGAVSANRTYQIFNQNGWGRSLHFLAAWSLVIPGVVYLGIGLVGGYFRARIWPAAADRSPGHVWQDAMHHLHPTRPSPSSASQYGPLQKWTYTAVIFVLLPLMGLTGLTMAPAVTAAAPALLRLFGGYESARTIHFAVFVSLALFLIVHVVMVVRSGFRRQLRGITLGD